MIFTWQKFVAAFVEVCQSFYHTVTVRAALAGSIDAAIISGASVSQGTERSEELYYDLREAGFEAIPGMGAYKGLEESAILVFPQDGKKFDNAENVHLLRLAKKYYQESTMFIIDGKSSLRYTDAEQQGLESIGDSFLTGDDVSCDDACSVFAGIKFSATFSKPEKVWNTTKDAEGNTWSQLNDAPPSPASNWQ